MPRKSIDITHELPYHIVARSNNKEWFGLSMDNCWAIFTNILTQASFKFNFQIHAFVLMSNHYHLIATTSEKYQLPEVMHWIQMSVTRTINKKAGRINHLFGGPYNPSLIDSELYYFHAIRYLYQNPTIAGIVNDVFSYRYSTLNNSDIPLCSPITGIESYVPTERCEFEEYLNIRYSEEANIQIEKAIRKKVVRFKKRLDFTTTKELYDTIGR